MFIVVEGIDGCGKSTVASLLAAEIGKKRPVFHTFETGARPRWFIPTTYHGECGQSFCGGSLVHH